MSSVPLFVVEEHQEAFIAWHWSIANGVIPAVGNTLLHVDEHDDFGVPRLRQSLDGLGPGLSAVRRFTYDELTCFEFIVPAIYQRIFSEHYWIKQRHDLDARQIIVVRSNTGDGRRLGMRRYWVTPRQRLPAPKPGRRVIQYHRQTESAPLGPSTSLVLDIDLDYFSCDDAAHTVQRVEISESEYEKFRADRYHFLRISFGTRVKLAAEGGRYFLYLDHNPDTPDTPLRVSETEIVRRIDRFTEYLKRNRVRPRLIDIARSRLSGYTPGHQWELIENTLLDRLGSLYDIDKVELDKPAAPARRE